MMFIRRIGGSLPPPLPPRPPSGSELYERGSQEQLRRYESTADLAKEEATKLYRQGSLLEEEVTDLWCNIEVLKKPILEEIETQSLKGKSRNWKIDDWVRALKGLQKIVDERIQLIRDFLNAFGSTLCLTDKQKVCRSYGPKNCLSPCVLDSSGSEIECKYPFSKSKNLFNYPRNGKYTRCPFQPSPMALKPSGKPCEVAAKSAIRRR